MAINADTKKGFYWALGFIAAGVVWHYAASALKRPA